MNDLKTPTVAISIHLLRPGVGVRDYRLPSGATLADLLRQSGNSTTDRAILVDGLPPEESLPLRDGSVVTLVPRLGDADELEPWRAAIPAFRDEVLSREYSEALEARRGEDDLGEDRGA